MSKRRRRHAPSNGGPFNTVPGAPPRSPMSGGMDPQMMGAMVRQMVTQEIMGVTNQFISHMNELAMNNHTAMSMIEVIRRILEDKGVITIDEFNGKMLAMQKLTHRANEIANDFDTTEEDRVKMMLEECDISESTARELIEHAKTTQEGLSSLVETPEEGESDEQREDAPEPE